MHHTRERERRVLFMMTAIMLVVGIVISVLNNYSDLESFIAIIFLAGIVPLGSILHKNLKKAFNI